MKCNEFQTVKDEILLWIRIDFLFSNILFQTVKDEILLFDPAFLPALETDFKPLRMRFCEKYEPKDFLMFKLFQTVKDEILRQMPGLQGNTANRISNR